MSPTSYQTAPPRNKGRKVTLTTGGGQPFLTSVFGYQEKHLRHVSPICFSTPMPRQCPRRSNHYREEEKIGLDAEKAEAKRTGYALQAYHRGTRQITF
jgi:hypothetical protein